ncbi:MAG: hypothetical protein QHH27_11375, partial [Clostridia bacterium]|nr:hypothetical protein [Clostridia bacterium]
AVPDKVRLVGRAMGLELPVGLSAGEVGTTVANAIRSLCRAIGIPTFGAIGLNEAAVLEVVPMVLTDGPARFVPKPIDAEIVSAVLKKAYRSYA